jgi:hypothetical protein
LSRRPTRSAPLQVEASVSAILTTDEDPPLGESEVYSFEDGPAGQRVLLLRNGEMTELTGVDADRARRWVQREHLRR